MIKNTETMRRALKRGDYSGVVLYDGPSKIDGAPIVAIACRITEASGNGKTGAMVQTFIMRRDIAPHEALKTGDDSSVCGDCPLRPIHKGATRCYVRVYQAPLSVWNAYHRGRYAAPGVDFEVALLPELCSGLSFPHRYHMAILPRYRRAYGKQQRARKEPHGLYAPMAQENRRGAERPLHGERGFRV
jgi:hypothetical protein